MVYRRVLQTAPFRPRRRHRGRFLSRGLLVLSSLQNVAKLGVPNAISYDTLASENNGSVGVLQLTAISKIRAQKASFVFAQANVSRVQSKIGRLLGQLSRTDFPFK